MDFSYVFLGAGVGGVCRHILVLFANRTGMQFPLGTLLVNLLGCFVGGFILFFLLKNDSPRNVSLFFVTGILGGFTTFSAFGSETFILLQKNQFFLATLNILLSLSCFSMTYAGYQLAQKL